MCVFCVYTQKDTFQYAFNQQGEGKNAGRERREKDQLVDRSNRRVAVIVKKKYKSCFSNDFFRQWEKWKFACNTVRKKCLLNNHSPPESLWFSHWAEESNPSPKEDEEEEPMGGGGGGGGSPVKAEAGGSGGKLSGGKGPLGI